jgi:hypothetical protein
MKMQTAAEQVEIRQQIKVFSGFGTHRIRESYVALLR